MLSGDGSGVMFAVDIMEDALAFKVIGDDIDGTEPPGTPAAVLDVSSGFVSNDTAASASGGTGAGSTGSGSGTISVR